MRTDVGLWGVEPDAMGKHDDLFGDEVASREAGWAEDCLLDVRAEMKLIHHLRRAGAGEVGQVRAVQRGRRPPHSQRRLTLPRTGIYAA